MATTRKPVINAKGAKGQAKTRKPFVKKSVKTSLFKMPEKEHIGCYFYLLATVYYGIGLLEKVAEHFEAIDMAALVTVAGNKVLDVLLQLTAIGIIIFKKR